MAYFNRSGDVISLDNKKAGALTMSVPLEQFRVDGLDPISMFAKRDAYRTVAEAIASNIAVVPLNVYEKDEGNGRRKLADEETALSRALASPHPTISQYRFVESLQLDAVLWDRWAFLVDETGDGVELLRLEARLISFALDAFGRITHVMVRNNGKEPFYIPSEHVVFDVGYDPERGTTRTSGLSISHTLAASARELDQGAKWREAVLEGGPKVPMYVARPAEAPEWIKSGGRERFLAQFAGYSAEKAGQAPVLEDGMELKAAPQAPINEVAYRETRLAAQIEFAIAMHYPPELIGYREGTFSNITELREQLYVEVLGARITAFRQALNSGFRRVGLLAENQYVEENLASRLASAPEKQASILQTQVGAPVRTVNEARKLLNLPPVDGGDDLIVPLNVTKGGLASPTDTAPKESQKSALYHFERRALPAPSTKAAGYSEAQLKMIERFGVELSNAFGRQGDRILKALGEGSSPASLADVWDSELEHAELLSVVLPHSYALAQAGAGEVLDAYNPDREGFDDEKLYPWIEKAAQGNTRAILAGIVTSLAVKLFGADWREEVAGLYAGYVKSRGPSWATSIATPSLSFGAQDAAKVSGLTQKEWVLGVSDNHRESHVALAGEVVEADAVFSNGARWPGDPSLPVEEVADCHCRVRYRPAT